MASAGYESFCFGVKFVFFVGGGGSVLFFVSVIVFFSFGLGFFLSVFAFDVQIIKSLYIFMVALKSMFKRNTKRIAISKFIVVYHVSTTTILN